MEKDILKIMMHPIRIKIIQDLSIKKTATTKELHLSCGDCAQATLYRHIKALVEHDVIKVVSSHQINGIIEKVYGLADDLSSRILKDPNDMTKDDYINLFTQFVLSLLTDFSTYFEQEDAIKQAIYSIGFSTSSMLLTDEEVIELSKDLSEVLIKRLNHKAAKGRKMRKLSTIMTTSIQENN